MDETAARPNALGRSAVEYGPSSNILSRATGFIATYDYTLNPYAGCTFGCSYCYAAAFVRDDEKQAAWGQWVWVKENALELLQRRRRRPGTRLRVARQNDLHEQRH